MQGITVETRAMYPDIPSAMKPLPYTGKLSVSVPPVEQEFNSDSYSKNINIDDDAYEFEYVTRKLIPCIEEGLYDIIGALYLSKEKAEQLGLSLNERKLLELSFRISTANHRHLNVACSAVVQCN